MLALAELRLAAPAITCTARFTSGILSCARLTETLANKAPAGIVTDCGNGKRLLVEEDKNTCKGAVGGRSVLTLKLIVCPSITSAGRLTIVSVGLSLSNIEMLLLSGWKLVASIAIVSAIVPSIRLLSNAFNSNVAPDWPTGIVMLAGKV